MRRALAGSIALHGVLGAVLVAVAIERPAFPPSLRAAVQVIDVVEPPRADLVAPAAAAGGPRTQPAKAGNVAPARLVASRASRSERSGAHSGPAASEARATVRDYVAGAVIEGRGSTGASEGEAAGGDGSGGGDGPGGTGLGAGFGDGLGLDPLRELPPPPPAPAAAPVSRARPARLIYPSRQRDAGEDELFFARLVVDDDGYVVGARIVHGTGGPREDQAAQLIWRFRYAPALDDAGRAIRSTVEQSFLVGR